jgi:hypothetical protein
MRFSLTIKRRIQRDHSLLKDVADYLFRFGVQHIPKDWPQSNSDFTSQLHLTSSNEHIGVFGSVQFSVLAP